MYRVLQIPRKTLITTDEVIKMTAVDDVPDTKHLLQSIQIAEERFIKPAICSDLYYAIRDMKNVVVDNDNRLALQDDTQMTLVNGDILNATEFLTDANFINIWFEYLWKLTAECVVYQASLTNYSRFSASGEMQNNPASITNEGRGAVSVDLKTMQWKLKKILEDRIDPLMASMKQWLYDNRSLYPLHNCMNWYKQDYSGVSVDRKTGIIWNAYGRTTSGCYQRTKNRYNDNNCFCDD
jgi:hypothetical protein